MALLFFFLSFFLVFESVSSAQTYKYVDKKGTICFSDNPLSVPSNDGVASEEPNAKPINLQKGKAKPEIKDIFQLGQEILEKELAKPPEKQDRRLIKELGENLYGDISGKKDKKAQETSRQ
jgi:hypothetical protein